MRTGFSTSDRPPHGGLGRSWVAALAFAFTLLAALETDFRAHGQRPHVPDSDGVLALATRRAFDAPKNAVIIVGSSRALADLNAGVLSAAIGGRPAFQLAQDGWSCMPELEQIARATRFAGTVLCGVDPTTLFGSDERDRERTGFPVLRLPSVTWAGWLDARIGILARSHFAILGRDIRVMARPILGAGPWPDTVPRSDPILRVSTLRYAGTDTAAQDARWARLFATSGGREITPAELQATIAYLAALDALIEARGGRVLFVQMPSSGRTRAVEDARYPRGRYWDAFGARIGAPAFATRDDPALDRFICPDGSHLDAGDAAAFTRALASALERRGMLR